MPNPTTTTNDETVEDDVGFLARDTPDRPHALVAVGTVHHPPTVAIAKRLAQELELAGFIVEIADASTHAMPMPPDYELVVIGLSVSAHRDHDLMAWIEGFSPVLRDVTSALFVVGHHRHRARMFERLSETGWAPHLVTSFPEEDEHLITTFVQELATLVQTTDD